MFFEAVTLSAAYGCLALNTGEGSSNSSSLKSSSSTDPSSTTLYPSAAAGIWDVLKPFLQS